MDDEVQIPSVRWRCGAKVLRADTRNRDKQGDGDTRGPNQSCSCALVDLDTSPIVGLQSSAIFEGKSSHRLLSEYQVLKKRYWGQHLWLGVIG